ncbi:MAG: protein-disulfide reductase DsbD [Gammaproteobacteria bacterium]|nr:protein-disulfide reductase DsbD [Gammaproteobacteria bacterium]
MLRLRNLALFLLFSMCLPVAQAGILDSLSSFGDRIGSGTAKTFLPPDQAFIFTADAQDAGTLMLHWQIVDGYHLYKNKFQFELLQADGVKLGPARFPQGRMIEDESFGRLESYFEDIDIPVPLERQPGGRLPIHLQVGYQGCADDGFCYPPIKKTIDLVLPEAMAVTSAAGPDAGSSPVSSGSDMQEQDRFVQALINNGLAANLGMMFVAGLLLAFTPCVFPMVPILSAIIVGQGTTVRPRRAFVLTLIYVLAMALTYTIAGILAGVFGQSVQAAFQNPWILGAFSLLFIALALSMFGIYELQMPSAIQQRLNVMSQKQATGTYVGSAVMGFLSALIVGPCVAAPMAGVLLYISTQGDAVIGGLSLFVLSLGMGLPLLIFGVSAGRLLPKAGAWMHVIRPIFGVMMLGVSIWMLERILPFAVTMFLWACLIIGSAVYLGALERLPDGCSPWKKLWKATGVVLLMWGAMLIIGAGSGGNDPFSPLSAFAQRQGGGIETGLQFKRFSGLSGLERELQVARDRGQAVMVDFYADWCVDCRRMEANTFSDPVIVSGLSGVRLLQADVTANDADDQALLKRYQLFGPPAILFFDRSGNEVTGRRLIGYQSADELRGAIKLALGDAK